MADEAPPPIQAIIAPVTGLQQNCTIVWCVKTLKAAVIDPGGEIPKILEILAAKGLTLEKIWLTHGHADHAGGTAALRRAFPEAPIEGPHIEDLFLIERLGANPDREFRPDRWLVNGDKVTLGETEWEVYHCPGHTPGHVVFFQREAQFAQVGDVLFQGSIGRTDLPRGNYQDLITAITTRLWPLGEDVVFVPGHGPVSTFGQERQTNPWVADQVLADPL